MSLPKIKHPLMDVVVPSTNKSVRLRPMLVKEEKILLIAKQSGDSADILKAMYQIVNNCLQDVDLSTLTTFDLELLYLRLRAFSVNNVVKQSYRDEEDDKIYNIEVNLDDVKMEKPEKTLPVVQVNDDLTIAMAYPKASLYADDNFLLHPEEFESNLARACIGNVYQGDKAVDIKNVSVAEFTEFVDELPINAFNKIKEFTKGLPAFTHTIEYTNSKGTVRTIKLQSVVDFFIF